MKNEDLYKSAMNKIPISESFEEDTIALISNKESPKIKLNQRKKLYYVPTAFALLFLVFIPVILFISNGFRMKLEHSSKGIKAKYIDGAPNININYDLIELSPEEIIHEWSDAIFRGTVEEIENIKVSFGLNRSNYWAIATIRVGEVYKGDIIPGDYVDILLPCPIQADMWVEDTEVVSAMRLGMEGIFMPMKYDDTSVRIENDKTLYLTDISEYGFADGARFAFLQTQEGLIYSEWAFDIMPRPMDLDGIKEYLVSMIN